MLVEYIRDKEYPSYALVWNQKIPYLVSDEIVQIYGCNFLVPKQYMMDIFFPHIVIFEVGSDVGQRNYNH